MMLWTQRLTVLTLLGVLTFPAPGWGQEAQAETLVAQGNDEQSQSSSLLRDIGTRPVEVLHVPRHLHGSRSWTWRKRGAATARR